MRSLPGALLPGAHPRGGPSGPSGSPLGIPLQSDKVTGQGQLPSRAGFIQRPGNLPWGAPRAQTTAPAREARNEAGACQAVWRPDGGALEATRPLSPSRVPRDTGRVAQLRVLGFGISDPRRPLPRLPPGRPPAPPGERALPHPPHPGPLGRVAMADSGGTGSSGPWWKSLTNSRKKSKEAAIGAQPPTQAASGEPAQPAPPSPDWTSSSRENQHPNLLGGAGDPHKPDKLCGEKSGSSRRNLKISRSGRFKEKRKVRATLLPEGVRSPEEAGFPGDPQEDTQ
ncbi:proline-rich protein 15 isoform X1 [Mustela putorius furo]|uniref:Proline-rich protein 15 isoform X1 n=2 Tax=Mustela putorius furo TaxID=9669 RepID=A0A8U0SZG3_MUSPF|nr:proline-rich protein 15 isoform X1 [Mustela putorius furo]